MEPEVLQHTSVWSFPKRGSWSTHTPDFRGNWAPQIPRNLIQMYSKPGQVVLDPFLGTGTTMFAAMSSGRNSIGYEIEPKFNNLIDNRIKAIKELANDYNRNRIRNHIKFIENRELKNKQSNYIAENYGFKVITKQEIGILLYYISEIRPFDDIIRYKVKYEPLINNKKNKKFLESKSKI